MALLPLPVDPPRSLAPDTSSAIDGRAGRPRAAPGTVSTGSSPTSTADVDGEAAEVEAGRLVHLAPPPAAGGRGSPSSAGRCPTGWRRPCPSRSGRHQVEALDLARAGRSVVVATGTASGKSRCYQLAIGEAVTTPVRPGTGLILFPTKALAHDQLRALTAPRPAEGAWPAPTTATPRPRSAPGSASTPTSCSPTPRCSTPGCCRTTSAGRPSSAASSTSWSTSSTPSAARSAATWPSSCAGCGAWPRTTAPTPRSSAARPRWGSRSGWPSALTGVEVTAVLDDGSPQSARTIALWQPPLLDRGHRRPGVGAPRDGRGRRRPDRRRPHHPRVHPQPAGHRDGRRRRAPPAAPAGWPAGSAPTAAATCPRSAGRSRTSCSPASSPAVVATSALELGIDVGGLDAVVLDGFPGTVASFWQQVGRAGRSADASAAVLVAGDDQLDQWFAAHPDELLGRPPEPSVVNPDNPLRARPPPALRRPRAAAHPRRRALVGHRRSRTACAGWPSTTSCSSATGAAAASRSRCGTGRAGRRTASGLRTAGGAPGPDRRGPHRRRRVGDVDRARAPGPGAPGRVLPPPGPALAGHLARPRRRGGRGRARRRAHLHRAPPRQLACGCSTVDDERDRRAGTLHLGAVEVCVRVVGYQRKDALTGALVATEALELPDQHLRHPGASGTSLPVRA